MVRKLSDKIGQQLTDILSDVAKENKDLQGIIDRVDFNATTHGQRDIDDDRLSKLIEKVSEKRLGLKDVEPDMEIYDPCCGSGGLLIKCEMVMEEKMTIFLSMMKWNASRQDPAGARLTGAGCSIFTAA